MKKQEAIKYLNGVLETVDSGLLLVSYNNDDEIPEYVIDFITASTQKTGDIYKKKSKWEVSDEILYKGRHGIITSEEDGQGNYAVTLDSEDRLGDPVILNETDLIMFVAPIEEEYDLNDEIIKANEMTINLNTTQPKAPQIQNMKEEAIVEQQVKDRKDSTMLNVSQFPTTVTGEIDYAQIQEPMEYAKALMLEFGEEAVVIVDELILEQQALLDKAEKLESAIERKRKVKAYTVEIDKLNEVRAKLTGGETQINKNNKVKSNQPDSYSDKNIKSPQSAKNIITALKKHKLLTSIGLVLFILMLSNPSNSRYADYLRANGINLKNDDGYGSRSPQWGKDQNYLFFSIFKYHSAYGNSTTHIGFCNNFYEL